VQVFEEGKRCSFSSFRLVRAETGEDQPTTVASREARAVSRVNSDGEPPANVVALVFDLLDVDAAQRARQAALDMAGRQFPAGTWFTVFKVGAGLRVLQPFTTDTATLPNAIALATRGNELPREVSRNPGLESATEDALSAALAAAEASRLPPSFRGRSLGTDGPEQGMAAAQERMLQAQAQMALFTNALSLEQRSQVTLYPLLALARSLSSLEGRKTILFFSQGLHMTSSLWEVLLSTISEVNRANATVYAFDAGGLGVESPVKTTKAALEVARLMSVNGGDLFREAELVAEAPFMNVQGNLQNLAESTGGFLVANTNDLRPGLERVAADLRSYYEIAYVPPNPKPDGRWRGIKVKVTRHGLHVRARKGYFAMPPGKPVVRPSELPLLTALDQSPLPRQLELRAATVAVAGTGPDRDTLVLAEVPVSAATFTARDSAEGRTAHARLSLLGLVRDDEGRLVSKLTHDAPFDGPTREVPHMRRQTLVVRRTLTLPPGRYTLEVSAVDRGSGRIGARRARFEVRSTDGLELGGLVVVRPQPAPADAADDDPLHVGGRRGIPRMGDPVVAGVDPTVGFYLSLRPGPSAEPASVALEVRRDGQVVGRATPELPAPDANGRIAYLGELPADRFPPGRYELWALARQGAAEARQATSFEVVASNATGPARKPEAPADVLALLERAGQYVVDFQESFRWIVAEETCRQWAGSRVRTLRSDLVFVTLPGEMPFATYRDVYEVDGQDVRNHDGRLVALLSRPDATSMESALALGRESARYNLGPVYRTVNVPTLALAFLHPRNQWRFRWEKKGRRSFFGHDGIELRAEETARPALVRGLNESDVPATARFWIEAGTGRVLRTETEFRSKARPQWPETIGWVDTQYRPEPRLGLWVPDEMDERHENVTGGDADFDGVIRATARYENHRRFEVDVSEGEARLPDTPEP
jgi:VWFA-related protein